MFFEFELIGVYLVYNMFCNVSRVYTKLFSASNFMYKVIHEVCSLLFLHEVVVIQNLF